MKTVWQLFFSGDKRTVKIKKNIAASVAFKGIDILIYLLLVPLTLGYLNTYEYGVWLTLNSVLLWINSFDIGLGNGLRNKLAIAIANNNYSLGRIYVSTTFYTLFFITLCLFAVFYFCCFFINWYSVFNVDVDLLPRLEEIIVYSFALFCLSFVFKFIGNVYLALQLPAITSLLNVLGHVFSLLFIWIITQTASGNLFYIAMAYSISPVIVYIIAYPVTFNGRYKKLSPSVKCINVLYLKDLVGIGAQFFFLQIAGIVLFASSNIIISRLLGPESVTPYNIAYRYFSVIPLVYAILITPMWSAVTDAYAKGDNEWIKKSMCKIRLLLFYTAIVVVGMVAASNIIYELWVGELVKIPFGLSLCMGAYIYILVWSLSYSNFLNGIGKLRIQVINTLIVSIIFFPLSLLLIKFLGILGMVIAMCLVNLPSAILNSIQFYKIFTSKKGSIWLK